MSHVKVVTLPKIGDVPIACKTKRDISSETPLDARDDESLGWGYWDRIWPSEVALSECLIHQFFPTKLQGVKVLEIGCGTGLAGVVATRLGAFTMFSDMVPIALEATKESCRLNHISNVDTCLLNWTEKIGPKKFLYDLVIGSEVFYDEGILAGISHILEQVLTPKGKAMFCDPNRLGLDTVEHGFKEKFIVAIEEVPLNWPPRKDAGVEKKGFLYQLSRRSQEAFLQDHGPGAEGAMNDDETPKPKVVTKYKNLSSKVHGFLKQQDGWLGHGRGFSHSRRERRLLRGWLKEAWG